MSPQQVAHLSFVSPKRQMCKRCEFIRDRSSHPELKRVPTRNHEILRTSQKLMKSRCKQPAVKSGRIALFHHGEGPQY